RVTDLVQAHGRRLVLMTQPVLWRNDLGPSEEMLLWNGWSDRDDVYYATRALGRGIDLYNQELLHVCAARMIDCIDFAAKVPRTTEVFYDDAHYTEKGAELVARVITEHLARREPFTRVGIEPQSGG